MYIYHTCTRYATHVYIYTSVANEHVKLENTSFDRVLTLMPDVCAQEDLARVGVKSHITSSQREAQGVSLC